jgi:hypothetical protein
MAQYFTLPTLASSNTTREDPAKWPPPIPHQLQFPEKQDFREWCTKPDTIWLFYSMVEALNPAQRPNLMENPPHVLHGFVADYDGDGINLEALLKKCQSQPDRIRPTWVTTTYSKKARVIWEFESPLQLSDDPKTNEKLLKAIGKELVVEKLAAGFDAASYTTTVFWEIGRQWDHVGGKVSENTLLACWLAVVDKLKYAATDKGESIIPLDVVEKGLAERYPDFRARWTGAFEPGARGPLFWINDAINRTGCVVTDGGVRSFSTRAAKGFMSWQDLLGNEFVKAYHQKRLGEAAAGAYFDLDTAHYAVPGERSWRFYNKEDMLMNLKVGGISHRLGPGKTCTEAEQVLVMIQHSRVADGAAPFLFNHNPVVDFNGLNMLNTAFSSRVLAPAREDPDVDQFPWLAEFFENFFDNTLINDCRPVDFFLAWLQRFWRSGLAREPRLGQLIVIAGNTGHGKSFMAVKIMRHILGGAVDACKYLLEGKGFNKELGASPVWCVDDATSTANFNDHKRFSEMLKKHTASPELTFHPKFRDAITVPWFGRIMITCNTDADSLSILPNLDGSILDKLMLFRCNPDFHAKFGSLQENEALLSRELPHFLAWLDTWEPPEGVLDRKRPRYGVVSYHHPSLVEAARDSSPDHRFVEILESWRMSMIAAAPKDTLWKGSCTDLIRAINTDSSLSSLMRSYSPVAVGRIMSKVAAYWKPLQRTSRIKGITHYHIDLAYEDKS